MAENTRRPLDVAIQRGFCMLDLISSLLSTKKRAMIEINREMVEETGMRNEKFKKAIGA